MIAIRSAGWRMMKVSDRVELISGEALKDDAAIMVNSGTCFLIASRVGGLMNMMRANRLCQTFSLMMRTGMRNSGSAPT
jgi:hypothetical protein